jgi:hypothetical protein
MVEHKNKSAFIVVVVWLAVVVSVLCGFCIVGIVIWQANRLVSIYEEAERIETMPAVSPARTSPVPQ